MAGVAVRACGQAGLWGDSGLGFTMLATVFQPEAFTVHLKDMNMMGQPVEKCACEAFRAKGLCPFIEWQI